MIVHNSYSLFALDIPQGIYVWIYKFIVIYILVKWRHMILFVEHRSLDHCNWLLLYFKYASLDQLLSMLCHVNFVIIFFRPNLHRLQANFPFTQCTNNSSVCVWGTHCKREIRTVEDMDPRLFALKPQIGSNSCYTSCAENKVKCALIILCCC